MALVTCEAHPGLHEDDRPLLELLAARGLSAAPRIWSDPRARWGQVGLAVVRSTWDYHRHPAAFRRWVRRAGTRTRLRNTPRTLLWNTDKSYLLELASRGLPVVPTWLVPRGTRGGLRARLRSSGWARYVVKPAVSADAYRTARFGPGEERAAARHLAGIVADRPALLQPYYPSVEEVGERSLVFLGGRFSHAVRKPTVLAPGGRRRPTVAVAATSAQRSVARRVLGAAPDPPLYARIDLVEDPEGGWRLMEAELTEPTLYLRWERGAAARFAAAIARTYAAAPGSRPEPLSNRDRSVGP